MNQKGIHRRDFLKYNLLGAFWAVTGIGLFKPGGLQAATLPDIGVARGDPAQATRAAVDLLGGIGRFVKPGNRVVIKPNMSWLGTVEWGVNTHPEVVRELVGMCREAGAGEIRVLDHTIKNAKQCLKMSGIEAACDAIEEGIASAVNNQYAYKEKEIPAGKRLHKTLVMKEVLKSDVLIAAPVAKIHSATHFTLSLKNMMGLVYDRREMHLRGLDTSIVDICSILKADLTVIDATRFLASNGPMGPGKVVKTNMVIAARDMVAADAYVVSNFDWHSTRLRPAEVDHIRLAHERGLGSMDIDRMQIKEVIL